MLQLKKLSCKRCRKVFFTYSDLEYCNTDCESKFKYEEHFNKAHPKFEERSTCQNCGSAVTRGTRVKKKMFCNHQCKATYKSSQEKYARIKASMLKEKKKGKEIPISILNRNAERRRVFDDKHAYWYTRRGGSYGTPHFY